MIEESIKKLLDNAKESTSTVKSFSGSIPSFGTAAVNDAKEQAHQDFKNGGGFVDGDIITFPTTNEELDTYLCTETLKSGNKSVSLLCAVKRGGKDCVVRVYPRWLHNDAHPSSKDGVQSESWYSHEGQPAEDARNAGMSTYDLFSAFIGKKVKVVRSTLKMVRGIRRGAVADDKGNFADADFIGVNRKFYTFEYITD